MAKSKNSRTESTARAKASERRQALDKLKKPPAIQPTAKSVRRAEKMFEHFKLAKAHSQVTATHRVASRAPAAVQTAHRKVMSQNLDAMRAGAAAQVNRAMTIALPPAMLKAQLPSFEAKKGQVDLSEVLTLLEKNMRGTEFYARGEPTLNRLSVQSQVQQLIEAAKQSSRTKIGARKGAKK